jgi:CubicO group peptidase (beta-lactamase class C family)
MPMTQPIHGMDPARLERIEGFLRDRYVGPGRLAGALFLVHRRGETAFTSVQGFADRERKTPLAEDTIFRIYSMTKPLTSVALMMLLEEGKLQLDDPVARYIPDWSNLGVYAGGYMETFRTRACARPMLVVDLLRHTSGLTYGFQQRTNVDAAYRALKIADEKEPIGLDAFIAALGKLPLEFSPGDAWNYSVSTDVAGYLVGKISGMPFEDFLAERLTGPLGMKDTAFFVPPERQSRFAACYYNAVGKLVLYDDPRASPFLTKPDFISGGGGLVSTASDYLRFCRMMLNRGELDGRRYLSRKTVAMMTANHIAPKSIADMSVSMFSEGIYAGTGFGLGFGLNVDPAKNLVVGTAGEYYWGGMASTSFWIDPAEELICILMTQVMPSSSTNIRRELRTLVYSAIAD